MRWRYVLHIIGALVACIGMTMFFPLLWGLYYADGTAGPLAESMAITLLCGVILFAIFRDPEASKASSVMTHREGMAIVALGWFVAGAFGGLPFYLSGTFHSIVDCIFESLSGFSTTGSSVLTDIEAIPRGILFWRSLTHWLGGMGIIVLSLAILPFLGVGGMQLYKAEVPGPVPDKLKPRIKDTAVTLWKVYVFFSVVETVLLMFGGMDFFDALCHTFGTMATGGFSTKNTSVAAFNSAYIDYVITIFMFIAGINFTLHYMLMKWRPMSMLKDPEFRVFSCMVILFTGVVAVACYSAGNYETVSDSIRYTSFQVASILTTTGFATADYELWPGITQAILLFCMFVGGCAGSTGGGMKVMRIMLLIKHSYKELFRLIHPRSVNRVKLGQTVVQDDVLSGVWGFFILWIGLFFLAAFIIAGTGVDVVTSFAASLACIGNIGPGIGGVGPTENFAWLPDTAKWVLTFCMVLGRLEIYTVVILFVPEFWRK
ncbi:TrkH family potassium uptake protein [Pseudodesulfovibrio piezophilus]|uniref:Trk system potassium uptake protein trkH n=1 Tax=Pseudodesulfovibrio piezophilus (strain DSM 21447 / JCM 15486 / C1TLV30) TaxID=1322246 RepID=M1WQG9_PSEP2|nr:TrkH family potassium uptake protein [Pseudodesulfovibrio piezophilus]CCH47697.1 Trk system potassium uptake protein trkH [Pseudodesulfovibrio piezophilus C1TLV30]